MGVPDAHDVLGRSQARGTGDGDDYERRGQPTMRPRLRTARTVLILMFSLPLRPNLCVWRQKTYLRESW